MLIKKITFVVHVKRHLPFQPNYPMQVECDYNKPLVT